MADDERAFLLAMQDLTSAFERLKPSHSLAEAMLIAKTVAHSVNGAAKPPENASTSASQPHPNTAPPKSESAKKRARKSPAARTAASIKRAAYLRSVADGLDSATAANGNSQNTSAESTDAPTSVPLAKPSPFSTPIKHTAAEQIEHALATASMSTGHTSEHAKRSREATPPVVHDSPTGAPHDAKRAFGSAPKQLIFDHSGIATENDLAAQIGLLPAPNAAHAAVSAFIEASTRWRQLIYEGHVVILERVISTLSHELQRVDKAAWGKHLNERLGKVAGYECKLAHVKLKVPQD